METTTVEDVFEVMKVSTVEAEVRFAVRGKRHKTRAYAAAVQQRGVKAYAAEVPQL